MSILIENMEMPEKCGNCFLRDGIFCIASNYERISYNGLEKKESWCPLVEVSSVKSEPKWIPCSERLPEDKTAYYLATVANRGLFFTTTVNNNIDCVRWDYDRRKGQDSWHWCTERTVLAWMLLPEPWKEGEQNEQV